MFAWMWKSLVQRWRRLGNVPTDEADAAQVMTAPSRLRSRPQRLRKSAPRSRMERVSKPHRSTAPRTLQVAKMKADRERGRFRPAKPTRLSSARLPEPRRTPPARHVWLEVRQPTRRIAPAAVIALPTRTARRQTRQTLLAAAA
jgi:hypothetical protein